jgi:hypothetical protein
MKNLKWIVFDYREDVSTIEVCENKVDAINKAKTLFMHKPEKDLGFIYAALANVDEEECFAEVEVNGHIEIDSTLYEIAWSSEEED